MDKLNAFSSDKTDEIDLRDNSLSKKDIRIKLCIWLWKKIFNCLSILQWKGYATMNIPAGVQAKSKLDYSRKNKY